MRDEKSPEVSSAEEGIEDKRKSSGSINSLKRLWEKEQLQGKEVNRLSQPTLSAHPGKPAVALKPSVASLKPTKNSASAIYATPTSSVINPKPPTRSGGVSGGVYAKSNVIQPSEENREERERILALCAEAEQMLSATRNPESGTQWMDVLSRLHSVSNSYADCIAPHGRFHFRQLVAKLETQSKEMKQTSSGPLRNSAEHTRLVGDVKNTVRDIANVLQR